MYVEKMQKTFPKSNRREGHSMNFICENGTFYFLTWNINPLASEQCMMFFSRLNGWINTYAQTVKLAKY